MARFVLVHGGFSGPWIWLPLMDSLRAAGIGMLSDEYWTVRLCVALCRGECKWSTISLKKAGLVHDLIEKI
jgi:hypothetical protein